MERLGCLHDKPVFSLWHSSILLPSLFHVWLIEAVCVSAALQSDPMRNRGQRILLPTMCVCYWNCVFCHITAQRYLEGWGGGGWWRGGVQTRHCDGKTHSHTKWFIELSTESGKHFQKKREIHLSACSQSRSVIWMICVVKWIKHNDLRETVLCSWI